MAWTSTSLMAAQVAMNVALEPRPMVIVTPEAVAVALALIVIDVADPTATMVAPAGIPAPLMVRPTSAWVNAAVAEVTVAEPEVVAPSVKAFPPESWAALTIPTPWVTWERVGGGLKRIPPRSAPKVGRASRTGRIASAMINWS
jgi:hypothetical protein